MSFTFATKATTRYMDQLISPRKSGAAAWAARVVGPAHESRNHPAVSLQSLSISEASTSEPFPNPTRAAATSSSAAQERWPPPPPPRPRPPPSRRSSRRRPSPPSSNPVISARAHARASLIDSLCCGSHSVWA